MKGVCGDMAQQSYNEKGELTISAHVREYLEHKNEYLQTADHLALRGFIQSEQAPGLFYNDDPTKESKVKTIDMSALRADIPIAFTAEMFKGNKHLEQIVGIETLGAMPKDARDVTDMHEMFAGCASLKSLDLGQWHMSSNNQVKSMERMFSGCESLESITFDRRDPYGDKETNWRGSPNMEGMFENCKSLRELDVSSFTEMKRPNRETVCDFAAGCSQLEQIHLPVIWWSSAHDGGQINRELMFHGDDSLRAIRGGTTALQEDQQYAYAAILRREGESYEQAQKIAFSAYMFEADQIIPARGAEVLQYIDERGKATLKEPAKEHNGRIYGESGQSRGAMAEAQFGHIGGESASMESQVGK